MKTTYNVTKAQAQLPKLIRLADSGKTVAITKYDETVAYLISRSHLESIVETLELLSNPMAMEALRSAKAGGLKYVPLETLDEDEG